MPRKLTPDGAKRRAWKAMSLYIRLKYADSSGYVSCVTCGATHDYRDMHAGHFVPKKRGNAIYFVEENCHPQCVTCNTYNGGNLIEYTRFIQDTYGPEKVDKLLELARTKVRFRLADYLEIEAEYKQKLAELT